ncbi:Gr98b family protein [Megaselia abdita]
MPYDEVNIYNTFYMKFQRILLSIYGVVPYPFQHFRILIYHVYSITVLCVILVLTYFRYIYQEEFQEEFGIAGINKISDVFIMIFICSTAFVHFLLQLDSMLKYKQYFLIVETIKKITKGVKVSKKALIYEITHLLLVISALATIYLYLKWEGLRGLLHLRIMWSEVCGRMKIIQYLLFVEIIDGCLSKAISRLSKLRNCGGTKTSEATKEFVEVQKYLRRVNEFEDQMFKYLGASIVISFIFETCTFIILMYISTLVFTGLDYNSRIRYSYSILYTFINMLFPCWVSQICIQKHKKIKQVIHNIDHGTGKISLETLSNVRLFSLQLQHWNLRFSCLGYFNINLKTFGSILTAAITYIFICIQFQQEEKFKN